MNFKSVYDNFWGAFEFQLFQKLGWLTSQCFGDPHKAGKREIVFAAFHSADIRPMHVGSFSQRLLRQLQFFSVYSHILGHPFAILVVHDGEFWNKSIESDIEVKTMEYNTMLYPFALDK